MIGTSIISRETTMSSMDLQLPSNKAFGLFFTGIFAISSLYLFSYGSLLWALLAGSSSSIILLIAIWRPHLLAPPNRLWAKFGFLLARFFNPLVLGFVFFAMFAPVGIIQKLFGRDALYLKMKKANTHWKVRIATTPQIDFNNQG